MSTPFQANSIRNEEDQTLLPKSSQKTEDSASTTKPSSSTSSSSEEKESDDDGTKLAIAFVLMLVFQLGNKIFGKLSTYPLYNYPLFMNLLTTVVYLPICFAYIIPVCYFSKDIITQEQLDIPKYKFFVMGAFDSLAGIMGIFAVNYIPSAGLIVLLQQSAIPISMAVSRLLLQARYTYAQYIGAGIVCFGIFVVLIPTLFAPSKAKEVGDTNEMMWIVILVLSCVPMCLSSVYKEKALGEVDIDVVYLNGWVAVFQSLVAIPLSFPTATISGMTYSQIIPNIIGGVKCMAGYNSILTSSGNHPADNCAMGPLYGWTFIAFNVIYNVLIIVVLKFGSANILFMSSTVIVPLSNVIFSLHFVPNHKDMQIGDILGLLIILIGLIIYRFMTPVVSFWRKLTGQFTVDEMAEEKAARKIAAWIESKNKNYMGINQTEFVQPLLDTRIWKEQVKTLFRTPQQIRGNLLHK